LEKERGIRLEKKRLHNTEESSCEPSPSSLNMKKSRKRKRTSEESPLEVDTPLPDDSTPKKHVPVGEALYSSTLTKAYIPIHFVSHKDRDHFERSKF
jgi:hypothetical protein